jgi:peroxiredoxin
MFFRKPQTDPRMPKADTRAPDFTLPDTKGKKQRLVSLLSATKGKPLQMWFFCACNRCTEAAREWGQLQKSTDKKNSMPMTIIVFLGDAKTAVSWSKSVGLDEKQTVIVCDPEAKVSENLYHASPCPRSFVLDNKGKILYINNGPDDGNDDSPAKLIVAKTVSTLQRLNPK